MTRSKLVRRERRWRAGTGMAALLGVMVVAGCRKVTVVGSRAVAQSSGGLQGEYFDDVGFTSLKIMRIDPQVDFNWANGSPDPSVGADTFSVRWTGTVTPAHSETYTFYTHSYDGARLWVNGQLLIDDWAYDEGEEHGAIALSAGQPYQIKLEYLENSGAAVMELRWSSPSTPKQLIPQSALRPPGGGRGLRGEYYDDVTFSQVKVIRTDAIVAFNWGNGSPDPTIAPDTFSVRWTGRVTPAHSETYTFYTLSYDGARLWVNGQLLIDDWTYDEGEESAQIALTAGQAYELRLEHLENSGAAVMELRWSSPSTPKQLIPESALSLPGPASPEPPVDDPVPPSSPTGTIFRIDFEDLDPACWVENATCGPFKVRKTASSIAGSERARSGTKAMKVAFTFTDHEGGGTLNPNADHVFYRFYDFYETDFDFARGMKIARFSGFDASVGLNQFDHIVVSRFLPNDGSACNRNDMGQFLVSRNGGSNFGFPPYVFNRGQWYSVEWEMKLNTPGQANGEVRLYVDGERLLEVTGRSDLRDAGDTLDINSLLVGGWFSNSDSNASCTPPNPNPARRFIDDVIVSSRYIGPEPANSRGADSTQRVITFRTPLSGTTQIEYGPDASYGQSTSLDGAPMTQHSQTITGLTAGRGYHYRVKSTWSNGYQYVSPDYTFVAR